MPARTAPAMLSVVLVLGACGDAGARTVTEPPPARARAAAPLATPAAAPSARLVALGRFDSPIALAAPPRDRTRVFVAEQDGRVRVVRNGRPLTRPFLDIHDRVLAGGEQGLLGLAFAPDYATSGRFYLYYTRRDGRQTLVEYRRSAANADVADPGSARVLFIHEDPEPNHNGGQLQFGPDGLLYIATGDGGGGYDQHGRRGNAQNLASPLGKILRIDPQPSGGRPYTVPASNPFVGRKGALPEIYAYGLRNPWRFSFDRATGAIAIGDVGQGEIEEVDYMPAGRARGVNFGWRVFEGNARRTQEPAPGAVGPVYTYRHNRGNCSISGGVVVRDRALRSLYGRYLFADFCVPGVRSIRLARPRARGLAAVRGATRVERIASFGEDAAGRVYVVSLAGPVYRLAAP